MSTTQARAGFDLDALRRGIEERDAARLIELYAEDAEMRLVDRINQPSSPRVVRGRAAIADYLNDICGRDMTHRVEHLMSDGHTVSFTESCAYPSGSRVLCSATIDLTDGRITRELGVQVWDE
jgi:ketosteroid isomerase-like protein